MPSENNIKREALLYFFFAFLMIGLNIIIQNIHTLYVFKLIQDNFGHWPIVQKYYLSTNPYDMPELIGSLIAVSITYVIKFFLDKLLVFKETSGKTEFKRTRKEFLLYFTFAILTTLENIAIQFFLGKWTNITLNYRITIALCFGYLTKFILDKYFVFSKFENFENHHNNI